MQSGQASASEWVKLCAIPHVHATSEPTHRPAVKSLVRYMPESDIGKGLEAAGILDQGLGQLHSRGEDLDAEEGQQSKALNNAGAIRRPMITLAITESVSVVALQRQT